ncbi:50S ribosomal protein L16 [bacterium]|nr:50S ribosomal protein L16 [bacterium]MBL7052412.1 50S ribosomal protein L16 [Candidatus Neomarinimicrobiota bacterium]
MLMPRKVKYRRPHRPGGMHRNTKRGATVVFGDYGLKATSQSWVSNRQIEAARVAITRVIRKYGKMWIRIFPDRSLTVKPAETRMGKGKGTPEHWISVVKPGRIMFEIGGVDEEMAKLAFTNAGNKLSVKWKIVKRKEV